jgi:hypothetical protein
MHFYCHQTIANRCSQLKHTPDAAKTILTELEKRPTTKLSDGVRADIAATLSYFRNNIHEDQFNYPLAA